MYKVAAACCGLVTSMHSAPLLGSAPGSTAGGWDGPASGRYLPEP